MLNEISQRQVLYKYCTLSLTCGILKITNRNKAYRYRKQTDGHQRWGNGKWVRESKATNFQL